MRRIDAESNRLRAAIAEIDDDLTRLAALPAGTLPPSLITGLLESWGRLVGLLAVTAEPELRPCPRCSYPVARGAKLCGHCWTKLAPAATSDA